VLAGKSPRTDGAQRARALEAITLAAPYVFLLGLCLLISLLAAAVLGNRPAANEYLDFFPGYFQALNDTSPLRLACWFVGCTGLALLMAKRVDVNLFSLHGLYANRLVRCYLGASRPKDRNLKIRDQMGGTPVPLDPGCTRRRPDAITGFDPNDDFPLQQLRIQVPEPTMSLPDGTPWRARPGRAYAGPFHLINTALNLTEGDELAWQERKAESFVLSPLYCGSRSAGYRQLAPLADEHDALSLGTATTVSGAAASPNMGYHSSPGAAALMTIFNVRLGGWYANPRYDPLTNAGPRLGLLYLLSELFGQSNARNNFVYLSDGGHFENLGVYELVRRRCRYIVASDAGADPNGTFEDLGNLIRKCRTDFGIRIDVDIAPLHRGSDGYSRWHCTVGTIHYDDVDQGAPDGTLLYLKSSLTGDEEADLVQFHAQDPAFPHNPTTDQFFNESKFESYRTLGYHIAQKVFADALQGLIPLSPSQSAGLVFEKLRHRWSVSPVRRDERFLKTAKAYVELHDVLRSDRRLGGLSREIYAPLDATFQTANEDSIAQLHVVSQMLQMMEDVRCGLHLDNYTDDPLYRDWSKVFQRWASSATFQRHYAVLKDEYSADFQKFCKRFMK
jgi:hypothetical protein